MQNLGGKQSDYWATEKQRMKYGHKGGVAQEGSKTPVNTVAFGIIMSSFDREWTAMLLSIVTCQKKISADQYLVTISQAKV